MQHDESCICATHPRSLRAKGGQLRYRSPRCGAKPRAARRFPESCLLNPESCSCAP
jgi:hypothetical protein